MLAPLRAVFSQGFVRDGVAKARKTIPDPAVADKLQKLSEISFESKADLTAFCSQARELVQLPNVDFPGVLLGGMDLTSAAGMLKSVKLPAPMGAVYEKAVDAAMQTKGVDSMAVTAAMQSRGVDLNSVSLEEVDEDEDESEEEEEVEAEAGVDDQVVANGAEEIEEEDNEEGEEEGGEEGEGGGEGEEGEEAGNKMGFSKVLEMLMQKLDISMLLETLQDFVGGLPEAIQTVAGAGMKLLALKSQVDKVRRDSMIAVKEAKKEKQRRASNAVSPSSAANATSPSSAVGPTGPGDLELGR
eukprot:1466868-Rhodomonas_salina.1